MDGIQVSELTTRELKVADLLFTFFDELGKLSNKSKENVYKRWRMLYLTTPELEKMLQQNLARINDASGADRRYR